VLLSFLSKIFVSTKWRIEKGILVGPRLLRQGISRGCRECELFFQRTEKCAKNFISRLYKLMEKKFGKEEKVSKNIPVGFFTKINSSEQ
jgi:hypothetical protein